MFTDNVYYREYQRLLVDLHALIADSRNQSPEAQQLRQSMERAETHLSEDEIVRLNALSADLSMIHGREIPDPDVIARVPAQDLPRLLSDTYQNKQWGDFLELLRAGVSNLWKPDQIAYLRSRAYEGLGEYAPAVAFMDEAAKLAPHNSNYRSLSLRWLWDSRQYQQAYARACEYLADATTTPRLVMMAAGIVAERAMQPPEPVNLNRDVSLAIQRINQALPLEISPNVRFAGLVCLGLLAVQLDDTSVAGTVLSEALAVETTPDEQVTSRWLLTREVELLRSGKAKTADERTNARQLVRPLQAAIAA